MPGQHHYSSRGGVMAEKRPPFCLAEWMFLTALLQCELVPAAVNATRSSFLPVHRHMFLTIYNSKTNPRTLREPTPITAAGYVLTLLHVSRLSDNNMMYRHNNVVSSHVSSVRTASHRFKRNKNKRNVNEDSSCSCTGPRTDSNFRS